jgi:superkiller protein 3
VIIAAKYYFDPESVFSKYGKNLKLWYLSESDKNNLREKSHGIVLTDNYAPVENLLTPVVRESAKQRLSDKYTKQADKLIRQGKLEQGVAKYEEAIQLYPVMSVELYNKIGVIQGQYGNWPGAVHAFQNALIYHAQTGARRNISGSIYLNLGLALRAMGKSQEAGECFTKAIEQFRIEITETPSHTAYARLGATLFIIGDLEAAAEAYEQALALNPSDLSYYFSLVEALQYQNKLDEAIFVLRTGIKVMSDIGQMEAVIELKQRLDLLEYQKSKQL